MSPGMMVLPVQSITFAPLGVLVGGGFDVVDEAFLKRDVDVLACRRAGAVDHGGVVENDGLLLRGGCDCGGERKTADGADD